MATKATVYEIITERITALLEEGTVPWHRPWQGGTEGPRSLISGKAYRGVNVWLLAAQGYQSPYWLTFKQAKKIGGSVQKGQKGTPIIFWKWLEDKKDKGKRIPLLRYYTVFNVAQCDLPEGKVPSTEPVDAAPVSKLDACEAIAKGFKDAPPVHHNEARAYYRPSVDWINMPAMDTFDNSESYYSVLFHEMTHSTGHENRLNRDTLTEMCAFGDTNYSKEELVAEMGAAFLCGVAGIENTTIDNSAAYIKGWLEKLKSDPKLLIQAGGQAQKAADHILGVKWDAEKTGNE